MLKNKPNFNDDAKELCVRIAEGIQSGRNLAEVREEFNREMEDFEQVPSDGLGGGTEGGESGGDKAKGSARARGS